MHGDSVYTVVGVLKPTGTVLDRLVLVNPESVWFVHEGNITDPEEKKVIEDERQVTVLLVQYATPLAAVSLPRKINAETNMQAASPAYETARLFRMIGVGADVIRAFGGVVLATAALSLFIALYHAFNERAYDIAVLRTLGARPASIAMMLMLEALMLAILGGVLGLLLAHGLAAILAWWMARQESLPINAWAFSAKELWLLVPVAARGDTGGVAAQLARGAGEHLGDARAPRLTWTEGDWYEDSLVCVAAFRDGPRAGDRGRQRRPPRRRRSPRRPRSIRRSRPRTPRRTSGATGSSPPRTKRRRSARNPARTRKFATPNCRRHARASPTASTAA